MPRKKAFDLVPLSFEVMAALQTLGHRIARARSERKYSQRAFADMMGVSAQTLVSLERGAPTVQIGHYARALWLLDITDAVLGFNVPTYAEAALDRDSA
jgi:transcriptional regulator with XRE-family HTH domain